MTSGCIYEGLEVILGGICFEQDFCYWSQEP